MTTVQLICLTPPPSHRMCGGGSDRMCGAPSHGGGAAAPGSASYHQKELRRSFILLTDAAMGPTCCRRTCRTIRATPVYARGRRGRRRGGADRAKTLEGSKRRSLNISRTPMLGNCNVSNGSGHPRHDCNIVSTFGGASAPGWRRRRGGAERARAGAAARCRAAGPRGGGHSRLYRGKYRS